MEIRVLGPVEVWRSGEQLYLARRQQRLLLGILAIEANRTVAIDRLIDLVWAARPPRQARAILHTRMSELRSALQADPEAVAGKVLTVDGGYRLEIDAELVDAYRFRRTHAASRTAAPDDARSLLREALSLWRGPVLGGYLDESATSALCGGLEAERLTAAEELFNLELQLGRYAQIAEEVTELAHAHPSRERLTGQMIWALHGAGRTAEALLEYDLWRRWLADEFGIDPGDEVQQLHVAILQADSALVAHQEAPVSRPGPPLVEVPAFQAARPRILPPDIADFTGRASLVSDLRARLITDVAEGRAVAIAGAGGIGKTALSVHVAHSVREEFPDGQLYVNLRGADQAEPMDPFDALGRFLRALGVDGRALPETFDERVDLYRDLLADRRVLVVLDNAASDRQIEPLIPGGARSAVIVNGRARMGATLGLPAQNLDVLDVGEATRLLSRIVAASRIAAEPEAVAELCRQCGGLPLAVRVAAAKLAAKPHWRIAKLVAMLADERQRLDHLTLGHLDVRATISLSYEGLAADVRQLLAVLGDLDLSGIGVWLSAAAAGTGLDRAEEMLEDLFDAQLIDAVGTDGADYPRYQMHDLVQLFAQEQVASPGAAAELAAARGRVAGAWLFVADAAHRSRYGGDFHHIRGTAGRWSFDETVVRQLVADPVRWFEAERHSIDTMVRRATDHAGAVFCWELVNATSAFFEVCRYFDEWQELLEIALAATKRATDVRGEAAIGFWNGSLLTDRVEYAQAKQAFSLSADLFAQCGDQFGYANSTAYVGMLERFEGDDEAALRLFDHTLPILREVDRSGEALVLRNVGQIWLQRGDYERADAHLQQAMQIYHQLGSRQGQAAALFWHGMLRLEQKRYPEARAELRRTLLICRSLGDRAGEAQCLRGLGVAAQRQGDPGRAASLLAEALQIVQQPKPTFLAAQIEQSIAQLSSDQVVVSG